MQRLDHAAIFVFIASTFTPIHTIVFKGVWRWGMLAFIWTCAIVGVTLKSIFFDSTPYALGMSLYLAMGWVGLVSGVALARRFGVRFVLPLVGGAVAYTGGAMIEFLEWPKLWPGVIGPHELFHAAVLLGAAFHWTFIKRCVDRAVADVATERSEPPAPLARAA